MDHLDSVFKTFLHYCYKEVPLWITSTLEQSCPSRVSGWPLMSTSLIPLAIILVYFLLVTLIGPYFMANRYPFQIQGLVDLFNEGACVVSAVIGILLSIFMTRAGYSFWCQSVRCEGGGNYDEDWIAISLWCYHFLKVCQLTDGVISILRHNPIKSVHTVHHCTMVVVSWIGVVYLPGGTTAILATMNCFTHAAVYVYYEVTNPRLRGGSGGRLAERSSSWPTFHTAARWLQLSQFGIVGLVGVTALLLREKCGFPAWASGTIVGVAGVFSGIICQAEVCGAMGRGGGGSASGSSAGPNPLGAPGRPGARSPSWYTGGLEYERGRWAPVGGAALNFGGGIRGKRWIK